MSSIPETVQHESKAAKHVRRRELSLAVVLGVLLTLALWLLAIAWLVDVFSGRVFFQR